MRLIDYSLEQLLFSLDMNKEYVNTTLFITLFNIILLVIVLTFSGLYNVFLALIFVEICLVVIYWILLKKYLKTLFLFLQPNRFNTSL